ncbi:hypothetical protein GCM10027073_57970 [Streptomyces chlorus]
MLGVYGPVMPFAACDPPRGVLRFGWCVRRLAPEVVPEVVPEAVLGAAPGVAVEAAAEAASITSTPGLPVAGASPAACAGRVVRAAEPSGRKA